MNNSTALSTKNTVNVQPQVNAAVQVQIEESWKQRLLPEFSKPYMVELKNFLQSEKQKGKTIYPKPKEYFNAFAQTPFAQVKVVILGQDPYHGPGQAHGLCFSVQPKVAIPPSLLNIYKELETDLQIPRAQHGYLLSWARQGVLLLNAVLTVENAKAGAHQNRGWEQFTDQAIRRLNEEREGLVFILWGAYAQKKAGFVDNKKHLVLSTPHPSPLSASRGFFGSRPFSKTNAWLREHNQTPIDWRLPSLAEIEHTA